MRRASLLLSCIALSAILQTLIFPVAGPLPFWRAQLAFVALVPWFLALLQTAQTDRRPLLTSTLLSYLCGTLWYAGHCYWIYGTMHQYGHLSATMAGVALLLFCLYLGLYHALFGFLAALLLRNRAASVSRFWPLLLALLWVALELARARVTSFPWDLLGYSQIDNAALVRLAPWGGTYAVSFVVGIANAMLACGAFRARAHAWRRSSLTPLLAGAGLAVLCTLSGLVATAKRPVANQFAVLLQPNLPGDDDVDSLDRATPSTLPLETELARLTEQAIAGHQPNQRVQLILWPEAPASYEMHEARLQSTVSTIAARYDATVLVDANAVDSDRSMPQRPRIYNAAGLFTREGLRARYEKIHLVPFGEFMPYASLFQFASGLTQQVGLFDRGSRRVPLSDGQHRYGVFICYESIFPNEVRQLALKGADVFVNLSDDGWYGDTSAPFQHSNMARMRAIENRRWLLRDTNTGITESIDPYGNVRASAARHQRLAVVMPYDYATGITFYTRCGDLFAWLCTLITAAALALSITWRHGRDAALT